MGRGVAVTLVVCACGGGQTRLAAAMDRDQAGTQGPSAQSTPAAPSQTGVVSASFQTCGDWKQTRPAGDAQLEAVWKVARLGFAHGISAGLQADPIGFYVNLVYKPEKPGGPDPFAPLGSLDEFYGRGLQAVINRPAVLVEGFDSKCADFKNESITLTEMTVIVIMDIGGVAAAPVDEALLKLRAGGAGAHAAMMAALRGK
jgi:hypothetical protein